LLVHIQKGFHHEVLAQVGETLAEFLQFDKSTSALIEHLDVLSRCELALLLDALLAKVLPDLVRVNVGVVLANLPDKGLRSIFGTLQESLLGLEDLFLDIFGRVNVEHSRKGQ